MENNGNRIPQNWKTIKGRMMIQTNANREPGEAFTIYRREDRCPLMVNDRTGEHWTTFLGVIRNADVFRVDSIETEARNA